MTAKHKNCMTSSFINQSEIESHPSFAFSSTSVSSRLWRNHRINIAKAEMLRSKLFLFYFILISITLIKKSRRELKRI